MKKAHGEQDDDDSSSSSVDHVSQSSTNMNSSTKANFYNPSHISEFPLPRLSNQSLGEIPLDGKNLSLVSRLFYPTLSSQ